MLDNPFLPRAREWLARKRAQEGWSEDSPTYRREYLGEWVLDLDRLVFRFSRDTNTIQTMPAGYAPGAPGWDHVIAIDYGYVDSTAWVVWAFRTDGSGDRRAFVVESFKTATGIPPMYCQGLSLDKSRGILPTEGAEITRQLVDHYQPWRIVGDAGGLGKPYMEEARVRYGIPTFQPTRRLAFPLKWSWSTMR